MVLGLIEHNRKESSEAWSPPHAQLPDQPSLARRSVGLAEMTRSGFSRYSGS